MEILLWLVPSLLAAVVAMVWVSIVGRQTAPEDRSEAAKARRQQRFAEAITRSHPVADGERAPRRRPAERSTGVAVRR